MLWIHRINTKCKNVVTKREIARCDNVFFYHDIVRQRHLFSRDSVLIIHTYIHTYTQTYIHTYIILLKTFDILCLWSFTNLANYG